jgi:hypothetical protein
MLDQGITTNYLISNSEPLIANVRFTLESSRWAVKLLNDCL